MLAKENNRLSNRERALAAQKWFLREVESLGGTVLGQYINVKTPVLVRCKNGHLCKVYYNNLRMHHTFCEKCKHLAQRKSEEQFQEELSKNSVLKALEPYQGARHKIKFRCPNGHELYLMPVYAIRGVGCAECHYAQQAENYENARREEDTLIWELATDFFEEHNRLPTCRDIYTQLGVSQTGFNKKVRHGHLQPFFQSKSFFEGEMQDFLMAHDIPYEMRKRNVIENRELDFYIPSCGVAIETNDVCTHNSTHNLRFCQKPPKPKNYHYQKSLDCSQLGIRLIHVWDYEWNDERKRPILENIILGACHKLEHRFYARKCGMIHITPTDERWQECNKFFEKNNIQGNRGGKIVIALVDTNTDEILMAYKFGHAFFGHGKYEWEMVRGATKLGCQVIGGASRLWKEFIRCYDPNSIVYYVDFNYFVGNGVEHLDGIEHIKDQISFKNYFVKEKVVKNRDPKNHKQIQQMVAQHKVLELYNAGTRIYVWAKNRQQR